jgi:hypothetical protein
MLSDIKLNDRIIYKDKKYTINNFSSNLTNGEVNFELITDFRPVEQPFALKTRYNLSADAQTIETTFFIGKNDSFRFKYNGVTSSFYNEDTTLKNNVTQNTTGNVKQTQIEIDYYNNGAVTSTRFIDIIQEP